MARVYNFSAGPGVLPEPVLQEAAAEMMDYRGTGMSVMEMSHRSKPYERIIEEAEADLRTLMGIPENYKVLFLQGGASQQFAMVPMNLMHNKAADYIVTGQFAKKAWKEAQLFGQANKIASSEDKNFTYIPDCSDLPNGENSDYVYICENNTIYGTKFKTLPNTKGKPLVADVSSCFLSEPVKVTDYGMLYGGAQKNVGPAGVVIAIIREDLIREDVLPGTPTMLRYKIHADAGSMYNTPPAYGIYICGKVFKWLLGLGGLEAMQKRNQEKAAILYDYLDSSKVFHNQVGNKDRSLMNATFVTGNPELDARFVAEAAQAGFQTICEIGKARIRRAGDQIRTEFPGACPDIGFRVFRVDEGCRKEVHYPPEEISNPLIGQTVSNIREDRTDLDLLYACLLDQGLGIHLPHTSRVVGGCTVHRVDGGVLAACFDAGVPDTVIRDIAASRPQWAVFRDSAFASDAAKINVTEIFKSLSPGTRVQVL